LYLNEYWKDALTKTDCGTILKLEGALHRMNMGDKMNIIDDATAFLFTIRLEELRGIY
jgi:hypothetical protein